jgi:hypothetical protein
MTIALEQPAAAPASPCDVRGALQAAILATWCHDNELFLTQTHQRAIMFRVGLRLASTVAKWPVAWLVDLEYNRMGSRGDPKRADGPALIPDLVIHHRGPSGSKDNLLAVEAKRSPAASSKTTSRSSSTCAKSSATRTPCTSSSTRTGRRAGTGSQKRTSACTAAGSTSYARSSRSSPALRRHQRPGRPASQPGETGAG